MLVSSDILSLVYRLQHCLEVSESLKIASLNYKTCVRILFQIAIKMIITTLVGHGFITMRRIGLIHIIIVVFIAITSSKQCGPKVMEKDNGCVTKKHCGYSIEAKRAGLAKYLQKVQSKYFEFHPEDLVFKPGGVSSEELKKKFKPYNPDPKNLKRISDAARKLLKQLTALSVNTGLLKLREKKALSQVKRYLESNFGTPYDRDYYAGLFLMGPNLFCWQPICRLGFSDIRYGLGNLRIKNLNDVQLVINKMKLVSQTFSQYIDNLRFGIRAGMVRSTEECIAGINAFKRSYFQVFLKGEKGMYMNFTVFSSACNARSSSVLLVPRVPRFFDNR